MDLSAVDTPALLVVKDIAERNMATLKKAIDAYPKMALRPHMKLHKSSYFTLLQAEHGVERWCCQKLCEAEGILPNASRVVKDLLITNEIIGPLKIQRLLSLVKAYPDVRIGVLVDQTENVKNIETALANEDFSIYALAEVNVGQMRCGVEAGSDELVELATYVRDEAPHIEWRGMQCYQGALQHVRTHEDRKAAIDGVTEKVKASIDVLQEKAGITCELISGGGTGTFELEAEAGLHNECQAGSYLFMDVDYGKNLDKDGTNVHTFDNALFVHTMVMSKSHNRVVVDAGMKALSFDSGNPVAGILHEDGTFTQFDKCLYFNGGDEHGVIGFEDPSCAVAKLNVGDTIQLIPGHCDPTVNMHSSYVIVQDGKVVDANIPIEGRGVGK